LSNYILNTKMKIEIKNILFRYAYGTNRSSTSYTLYDFIDDYNEMRFIEFLDLFEFSITDVQDSATFKIKKNIEFGKEYHIDTITRDLEQQIFIINENGYYTFTNDTYLEITQTNTFRYRFNTDYTTLTTSNIVIDGSGYVIERNDDTSEFKNSMFKVIYDSDIDVYVKNIGIYGTYDAIDSSDQSELLLMNKDGGATTTANVNIKTCFLDGTSITRSPFLYGDYDKVTISDCFSKCTLKNNNSAGFLALDTSGVNCTIKRSFFAGEFTSGTHAAGFIDISKNVTVNINECYSMCDIVNSNDVSNQSLFVSLGQYSPSITLENCYSLPKTNSYVDNSRCSIIMNASQITDVTIKNFYTIYDNISLIDSKLTNTTNAYTISDDAFSTKIQSEVDASLSNLFLVDDLGIIKGLPLLKCFTDVDGEWEPSIYQNFNSETRQKVFVQDSSYIQLFDNSTLVDADFDLIDNVHHFLFSGTDKTLCLLNDTSFGDVTYKFTIKLPSTSEKYIFNDISFDIIPNTNYLMIKTLNWNNNNVQSTTLQQNDSIRNIFEEINTNAKVFDLPIGTYEIDIGSGLYIAFEDASSNTGKNEDKFTYTGNIRSLRKISTRINTKDANSNDIDSELSYYTGKIYLNVKDITPIYLHYTIDRSFATTSSIYVNKTKFQVADDKTKKNNLIRDKFYTISYYGTQIDNNLSNTDTSYNRVRKAEVQVRSKLFQTFVNTMRLRGVQEFNEVITLLIKERRFVNPDITDGVDYNLLDVLMGNFPDEFIIYGYTIFDVIQEMIRSKNEPLSQKDVYYLRDLIRIYSKYFRIFTNDINKLIQYPPEVNNKLKTLMNNTNFRPSHNIYNDISYSDISTVENLSLNSERLELFEGLYDEELNSFLQRTNTANISNLQLLYPPKKDNEINALIQRDIYDVPPKIRFEDYSPNYIFFKDVSSILQQYNTRKKAELSTSVTKNVSFVSGSVTSSFKDKTMHLATTSDNGQYLFTILDNSFNISEISNNQIKDITELNFANTNPVVNDIERVYVSNDGTKVFMYTSKNIFMSTKDGSGDWDTKDGDSVTSMKNVYDNGTVSNLSEVTNTNPIKYAFLDDSGNIWIVIFYNFFDFSKFFSNPYRSKYRVYKFNSGLTMQSSKVIWDDDSYEIPITQYSFDTDLYMRYSSSLIIVYDLYISYPVLLPISILTFVKKNMYILGITSTYKLVLIYNDGTHILTKYQQIDIDEEDIIESYINDNDKFNMDMLIGNNNLYFSVGLSNYRKKDQNPIGIQYIYKMKLKDPPENNDLFDTNSLQKIYTQVGEQTSILGQRTKLGGIHNNRLYVQLLKENRNVNPYTSTSEIVIHDVSGNNTTTFTNK
jgi:hypothetical protein